MLLINKNYYSRCQQRLRFVFQALISTFFLYAKYITQHFVTSLNAALNQKSYIAQSVPLPQIFGSARWVMFAPKIQDKAWQFYFLCGELWLRGRDANHKFIKDFELLRHF